MHAGLSPFDNVRWRQAWKILKPQARLFCLSVTVLIGLHALIGFTNP